MKFILNTILVAVFIITSQIQAQSVSSLHQLWDSMLQKYVSQEGKVDYVAWSGSKDSVNLIKYLKSIKYINTIQFNDLSRNELLALYINTYNAYITKSILQYPLAYNIRDIKPNIWAQKIVFIAGKRYSLNDLENNILRKQFLDPRVHFCLTYSAHSSPKLYSRAYTAQNISLKLKSNTRAFLRDVNHNFFNQDESRISKIFKWYYMDFESVRAFLKQYAPVSYNPWAPIYYRNYDWELNSQ